jgi:hypothetical protein
MAAIGSAEKIATFVLGEALSRRTRLRAPSACYLGG